jgi:hypothetical protein
MTQKIVISKSGFNALTESDPNDLVFSSEYNTLKYDISGSIRITIPANGSPFTREDVIVSHNFGYKPFFTAFIPLFEGSSTHFNLPYTFADAGVYIYWFLYSTATQLILRTESTGTFSDVNLDVYYKVFKNDTGL